MKNRLTLTRALPITIVCMSVVATHAAMAQQEPEDDTSDAWKFSVGVGAVSRPEYPGASSKKTAAIPLLSANYGRFFIGGLPGAGIPAGIGFNAIDNPTWKFGIALAHDLDKPREESDDDRLRGLGDVKSTSHGAVFGSYTQNWFKIRGTVVTDIGGNKEGTTATLDLEGKYRVTPTFALTAGPGLTWADKKYTQTFFGIDATQSANSGLPQYDAKSGLNSIRLSVGAEYAVSRNWMLGARASFESLRGDARDSPITASRTQNSFGLFGIYRF